MNNTAKKYILIVCGFMIVGISCAFALKAAIGVGAWDALAKSISDITHIEVGTIGMLFNIGCVIGQILILQKDFKPIQLLQIPLSILLGTIINFVLYDLLIFTIDSYAWNIVMYLCASTVSAFGISIIMLLDEVTFALEGFCMAISKRLPIKFSIMRQLVDVISILTTIILKYLFDIPWAIGLGTIIGMLTFGPTLGIFMKWLKPKLIQMNLLDVPHRKQ